jgi:hypothetical protein
VGGYGVKGEILFPVYGGIWLCMGVENLQANIVPKSGNCGGNVGNNFVTRMGQEEEVLLLGRGRCGGGVWDCPCVGEGNITWNTIIPGYTSPPLVGYIIRK